MASGVSGYAALNARVRAMYSSLLSPQDMLRLSEATDFPSLIALLKSTIYGSYLENLKEKELTPRRVLLQIKGRLADAYFSVIHMAPGHARPLLMQLYRYYEVGNLKAILRAIVTGPVAEGESSLWDQVSDVLFPMGSMSVLPARAMVEAGSVAAAVELLRGTRYEETLSFAMKRYSAEQNLFPLEVALDLNYWRQLWREAKRLSGLDREYATRVIGSLLDMNNLMWAIRYRVYHQLSEEELINYTLPFGYRVKDDDIRAIAAGADIAAVVGRIYPAITDINELLADPHRGLPLLEARLNRYLVKQCFATFTGNPFHIGIPLAFLILTNLEIEDLTILIEARSSQLPDEKFRPFLLKTAML
ncbi:MAG TPA: V-type ATPase subunit [Anaerolineales bacterium]|nr:V-type ATPase subunit [Anaerolineales bacterium]